MPYESDAEVMWRDDGLYDLLAVIGYNDAPTVPGLGSAIFLHVARPDPAGAGFSATVGCVALALKHLTEVLAGCGPGAQIDIRAV